MKKVYIAGPMRGKAHFNFDSFDHAAEKLKADGWVAISPTDMDRVYEGWEWYPPEDLKVDHGLKIRCISRDLALLITFDPTTDAIYLLKGWEDSKGALTEKALAEFLGLTIMFQGVDVVE